MVRPIAARSSAATGGRGAVPWAETIRVRSNLSSASLCRAVSTDRATTCTPPARLAVGATSSVTATVRPGRPRRSSRRPRQAAACASRARRRPRAADLARADRVVDRLGARGGPHRAGAHREVLPLLDRPARVLAGQARPNRVIGDDLHHRASGGPRPRPGTISTSARSAKADPRQLDAGEQSAAGLDPAVDVPAASRRVSGRRSDNRPDGPPAPGR